MFKISHILVVVFLVILFCPAEGYSYIDPGAGSNYLQRTLGGLFSFMAIFKSVFIQIFRGIHSIFSSKDSKAKEE